MNLEIKYRRATQNDIIILSEHRVKFINEVFNMATHPDELKLKDELITYFSKSLKDKSVIAWLALYEDKVIATSCLVIWHAPMSYAGLQSEGKRGYILNMYTLGVYRKKGIASRLLEKLIGEAKKMKLEYVSLHATEDGMRVYKNKGFAPPKFPELKLKIE